MKVPFVDLAAQYAAHKSDFDSALSSVIARTAFVGGEFVREFETAYASAYGVEHCVSCANGTDAIYIALRSLGVGPGDEVITSACSWIATSETVSQAGARPVFVDVDENSIIDTTKIAGKITPRTKAIIPVHLFGQAAPMDAIMQLANERGLHVIEDCAQAHFAQWRGRNVGTFGRAATFSFYPGKNLGAWGDAGAIVTDDAALARRMRLFANHGALVKHQHEIEGINSRLDGLQASLLTAKLRHIGEWTRRRQAVARIYDDLLRRLPEVRVPHLLEGASHVYHLYVIHASKRDQLRSHLASRGIETAIHYPTPLPLLPAYSYMGHQPSDFPVASRLSEVILSLPIYPEMTEEAVRYVVSSVAEFYGHRQ